MRLNKKQKILIFITTILSLSIFISISITLREHKKSRLISKNAILAKVSMSLNIEPDDLTNEDFANIKFMYLDSAVELRHAKDIIHRCNQRKIADYKDPDIAYIYESTKLSDESMMIYDLKFIENLVNLEHLQLLYLPFYDVDLTRWKEFLFKFNVYNPYKKRSIDLSPLKKLENLKYLKIDSTEIKNFKPLAEIRGLETLCIEASPIRNKKQISLLHNIETLILLDTEFSNLKPLEGLRELKELTLSNTNASGFESLRNIINLQSLTLNNEQKVDFGIINELVNLRELKLSRFEIDDLSVIKDLKNLRLLALQNVAISDLSKLELFPDLKEVWISECKNISKEQFEDYKKSRSDIKVIECDMFFDSNLSTYIY